MFLDHYSVFLGLGAGFLGLLNAFWFGALQGCYSHPKKSRRSLAIVQDRTITKKKRAARSLQSAARVVNGPIKVSPVRKGDYFPQRASHMES